VHNVKASGPQDNEIIREHGPPTENQEAIDEFPNYYNYETQEIQQKMGEFNFENHGIPEFPEYHKLGPYRNKQTESVYEG